MTALTNLLDLDPAQLAAYCGELGEKPFRAKQLQRWIHQFGVSDFDAMTDLAKSLREKLKTRAYVAAPAVISDHTSSDGTRKWLLDVGQGNAVETVFIPEESRGTLQLFRKQSQLDATAGDIAVLKQYGVPYEVLDRSGCIGAEPALAAVKEKFVGGLRLPDDETGDCHMFTQALAVRAAELGVQFAFGTSITRLVVEGARISGVVTSAGLLQADAYVVALGSWSPHLLKPLGISIPVYPVKGYSITVPVKNPAAAPLSTVMDESYKVAITRLGGRIRVGGAAEISGYSNFLHPARQATLDHSLTDLFPGGGDLADANFWCGLRPMTPDGPPLIGPTPYANLHLNTGHGTLGWTMACGSGRVLADVLSGRKPEVDIGELAVSRYAHRFG